MTPPRPPMTAGVHAVILAGGAGRRMGDADKGLASVGGQALLTHLIARLSPQVPALALNAPGAPARFAAWGLEVVGDTETGAAEDRDGGRLGPLAGILAGMDWAASRGGRRLLTAAWDTPWPPRDLAARLAEAADAAGPAPVAVAESVDAQGVSRAHPTFALWDLSLREALRRDLRAGARRVLDWAEAQGAIRVPFPSTPFDPFFNVNAPKDLAEAEEIWRAHLDPSRAQARPAPQPGVQPASPPDSTPAAAPDGSPV